MSKAESPNIRAWYSLERKVDGLCNAKAQPFGVVSATWAMTYRWYPSSNIDRRISISRIFGKTHSNATWRVKAFEKMELPKSSYLFYTAPMSISEEQFSELRKRITEVISELGAKITQNKPEKLAEQGLNPGTCSLSWIDFKMNDYLIDDGESDPNKNDAPMVIGERSAPSQICEFILSTLKR